MTKKTITEDDYLRLVGLLTLAADHRKALDAIERSACGITGDEHDSGSHTGDAVWGGSRSTADELLAVLDITVERPTTTPAAADAEIERGGELPDEPDRAFGYPPRDYDP